MYCPQVPNVTPFRSTIARFPDNDFPKCYNGKYEISKKKKKKSQTQILKSPQHFCEDDWKENSGQVWKLLAAICRSNDPLHRGVDPLFDLLPYETGIVYG